MAKKPITQPLEHGSVVRLSGGRLAEWNSLRTTYAAGRQDTYTLTYFAESPVVTYSIKFTGPTVITQNLGADQFFVQVPLRGTRD